MNAARLFSRLYLKVLPVWKKVNLGNSTRPHISLAFGRVTTRPPHVLGSPIDADQVWTRRMAADVETDVNHIVPTSNSVFEGLNFFLVQRLPFRSSYVAKIEAHGGRVVKLEQQADYIVADHLRRDCPPGSVSYTFLDTALKDGHLPDPADHVAGVPTGIVREVGSTLVPAKATRTAFTAEDDRVLWQWVERAKARGGMVKGNEIYKQLELRNSRHTFQAWRDRYIKKLMDKAPPGVINPVAVDSPPSSSFAPDQNEDDRWLRAGKRKGGDFDERKANSPEAKRARTSTSPPHAVSTEDDDFADFGAEEFKKLWEQADDIVRIDPDSVGEAWTAWAHEGMATMPHTPQEWRAFWERRVLPEYEKTHRKAKQTGKIQIDKEALTKQDAMSVVSTKKQKRSMKTEREAAQRQLALATHVESQNEHENQHKTQDFTGEVMSGSGIAAWGVQLTETKNDEVELLREDEMKVQSLESSTLSPAKKELKSIGAEDLSHDDVEEDESLAAVQMEAQKSFARPARGANCDVDSNAHQECRERWHVGNIPTHWSSSDISTSDANRATEAQLEFDPLDQDKDVLELEEGDPGDVKISTYLFEDGEVEDGLPGEEAFEADQSGAPLTEANLATQQAQHNMPPLCGTDLPVDGANKDPSHYLNSLQAATGGGRNQHVQTLKVGTPVQRLPLDDRIDEIDVTKRGIDGNEQKDNASELSSFAILKQAPSERDDEEILLSSFPSRKGILSRKALRLQRQSQSLDNQIVYPKLRPQDDTDDDEVLRSQPDIPPSVEYPVLPSWAEDTNEDEGNRILFSHVNHQHDRYRGNRDPKLSKDERSIEQDEFHRKNLDLGLAMPDAVFETSSPTKSVVSQVYLNKSLTRNRPGTRERRHRVNKADKDTRDSVSETDAEAAESQEVIELPSASSRSSSYQSTGSSPLFMVGQDIENGRNFDTQQIVNAETQVPDFSMPSPPAFDDKNSDERSNNYINSQSSSGRQSLHSCLIGTSKRTQRETAAASAMTQPRHKYVIPVDFQQSEKMDCEDIEAFISYVAVKYNIVDTAAILAALKATSARQELALIVLLEQKAARTLDGASREQCTKAMDLPGVWTQEEDRAVESGDARLLRKITEKHGWDECMSRMEFLTMWRQNET